MVTSFRYLGIVILGADDDCPEVIRNMEKAKEVWRRMRKILSMEVAGPRVYGFFFKAVVQLVLIFGAETWVVTPLHGPGPGGFPGPGCATIEGEDPTTMGRQEVGIHIGRGRKSGGRV